MSHRNSQKKIKNGTPLLLFLLLVGPKADEIFLFYSKKFKDFWFSNPVPIYEAITTSYEELNGFYLNIETAEPLIMIEYRCSVCPIWEWI